MKKLFTLIAFLTCFLGANAVEITDFTVDYTTVGKSTVGWKGEAVQDDWITADEDGLHLYNPEALTEWYAYQLWIFNNAALEVDMNYTIKVVAKVSDGTAKVRCRIGDWGGGISGELEVNSTEYQEYTFEGAATAASNGLLVQFGDYVGTVSFKSVTITHEGKEERPIEWLETITSGNAEAAWPAWSLETTPEGINANWRGDKANEICAWALTMGRNFDDQAQAITSDAPRARPFPADIEAEAGNESNHVFAVHVTQVAAIDDDANSIQWSNQFWIQSPKQLKAGSQVKISFRYKAEKAATVSTQIHKFNPSIYLHYVGIGDVNFTTDWQVFDKVVTIEDAQGGGYSVAFNLTSSLQEPNVFYFDDLSIQEMKLDEGLYVAGSNATTGLEYDYDNAVELVYDEGLEAYVATVGTVGKEDTWVNELMISTVRGNDRAFRANTIKPTSVNDCLGEDAWGDYKEASSAKIQLPAAGVWAVNVDTESMQMNFVQIEGDPWEVKEPLEEIPNTTEVVVKGQERDFTADEQPADPDNGKEAGTGQPWDNQFFIVANRTLSKGEETIIKFKYKASVEGATSGTQLHGDPGAYMHYDAIGSFSFTTEYQTFEKVLTIPKEADGMKSIAFNMAEIKGACDYYITDVVWMTADKYETLIDTEGTKNFYVKEGAGTDPYIFGTKTEVKGDLNGDGIVNALDIQAIINAAVAENNSFDQTGDGICNALDIQTIINIAAAAE